MATKITRISLQLRLIRVLLIIVLIVTLLLTGYLLVVGIDTIGDDLDAFREVHRSHLNHTVEDDHHNHRYDSHGDNKLPANDFGHTLTDGHGHDHREKDRETVSSCSLKSSSVNISAYCYTFCMYEVGS